MSSNVFEEDLLRSPLGCKNGGSHGKSSKRRTFDTKVGAEILKGMFRCPIEYNNNKAACVADGPTTLEYDGIYIYVKSTEH